MSANEIPFPVPPKPLRLGIIGCGKIAQNVHIPAIEMSPDYAVLAALSDADANVLEAVAARHGVRKTYGDYADLLKDADIDGVVIAVGDPLHVEVAASALRHGKHVLVEKPLGVSVEEALTLREAVKASAAVLEVGVMRRWDEAVTYAAGAVAKLGKVTSFNAWYRCSDGAFFSEDSVYLPVLRAPSYQRPVWKHDRAHYALDAHASHLFDYIRYVAGDVERIGAIRSQHGNDFVWQGIAALESGGVGRFELAIETHAPWSEGIEVYCEGGSVRVDIALVTNNAPSSVEVFDRATMKTFRPALTRGNPYVNQIRGFVGVVTGALPRRASVEDGLAALADIAATRASVASGGAMQEVSVA